jgi:hypothetical protein
MTPAFAQATKLSKADQRLLKGSDPLLQVGGKGEKGQIAVATAIRRRLRPGS